MPSQAPLRLIASVRSQRASSVVSTVPRGLIPALLTRTVETAPSRDQGRHHAPPVGSTRHIELLSDGVKPLVPQAAGRLVDQILLDIGEHNPVRGRRQ